ncbi:alkaline phosphatase D family protein [Pacificimonas flava]|uniref:Alkaline phosphatase n=1 Tax=Pacificimonas flava TaxID=1234595 RepID=M2TA48_9SPHN|nr:alkaline phosphatase D family protein [Pacificimonas flava]EMD83459.1 Alkaline phosphatase [Pacificimonas flava]MBB5278982.1 alkaline phosphatase D [Pacificimonas flava]
MKDILLDRRSVATATFSLGLLSACSSWRGAGRAFAQNPFTLGVAAGEPSPDGFVIWTRLAPAPAEPSGGLGPQPVPVAWEVAEDPNFRTIVRSQEGLAQPRNAHTVHVEVGGLQPHRPYWYRFHSGGATSDTGRATTLPAPGANVDRLHIASVGCQDFESGFFSAYGHLAREPELDVIFHYGDYIYEFGQRDRNPFRRHLGNETATLDDYRRRYAQYKSDPDLRAAHARAIFIPTFDDHEIDDNWAGDFSKDDGRTRAFLQRKANALRAWYEHMPVRSSLQPSGSTRYFRRFDFGALLRMHALDTRSHRSDQFCEGAAARDAAGADCIPRYDASRTMLGREQEDWLQRGLSSETGWNFIAQQVQMLPFDGRRDGETETVRSTDNWNGYPHARQRLVTAIAEQGLGNVVIGSGDMHQHLVGTVPLDCEDPESRPVASEFLATSITSGGSGSERHSFQQDILARNPNLALLNNRRGYQIYVVSPNQWRTRLKVMDQVDTPSGAVSDLAEFVVERGRPGPLRA